MFDARSIRKMQWQPPLDPSRPNQSATAESLRVGCHGGDPLAIPLASESDRLRLEAKVDFVELFLDLLSRAHRAKTVPGVDAVDRVR